MPIFKFRFYIYLNTRKKFSLFYFLDDLLKIRFICLFTRDQFIKINIFCFNKIKFTKSYSKSGINIFAQNLNII